MGTRGWLIFVYKGNYYILWNNNDSYASAMGVSLVEQIVSLVKQFKGDTRMGCDHWGSLLSQKKFVTEENAVEGLEIELHPFCDCHAYKEIQKRLEEFSSKPIRLEQKVSSSITCEIDRIFIKYIWEVNLDRECLIMSRPYYSLEFKAEWSFKSLYFMLKQPNCESYTEMWLSDADSYEERKRK